MRRRAAVGLFLALVTGCSQPDPQSHTSAPPQAQQPDGYSSRFEWLVGEYNGEKILAFAIDETDAVGVDMRCGQGTRSIRVSAVDPNSAGTSLTFGSGSTHATVVATPSQDSMIDDSTYAVAIVGADNPVFGAFNQSGEFWVWTSEFPMRAETASERELISVFLAFCEG